MITIPLMICSIIALACIVFIMLPNVDGEIKFILLLILLLDGVLGFGAICGIIKVKSTQTYCEPDQIFCNDRYLVAIYKEKPYLTTDARIISDYKETGEVKILQEDDLNCYNGLITTRFSLPLTTKKVE